MRTRDNKFKPITRAIESHNGQDYFYDDPYLDKRQAMINAALLGFDEEERLEVISKIENFERDILHYSSYTDPKYRQLYTFDISNRRDNIAMAGAENLSLTHDIRHIIHNLNYLSKNAIYERERGGVRYEYCFRDESKYMNCWLAIIEGKDNFIRAKRLELFDEAAHAVGFLMFKKDGYYIDYQCKEIQVIPLTYQNLSRNNQLLDIVSIDLISL